ncbi:Uncharacterized protein GBIM_07695, partial [Gryllus bimaculatus]
ALQNSVPPIYISKYNRFVDNILERINHLLRKSYDPVNVRLNNMNGQQQKNKNRKSGQTKIKRKNNKNRRRGNKNKRRNQRPRPRSATYAIMTTSETSPVIRNISMVDEPVAAAVAALSQQLQSTPITEQVMLMEVSADRTPTTTPPATTIGASKEEVPDSRARPQKRRPNNKNRRKNGTKNKNRAPANNRRKPKPKNRPPARATLYGLASLKREGDVSVNMMSSHTTVRTRFTIGPLMLKVEKEFGRGAKKDIRSAVATTTEMTGKLNLRVRHGGAAALHSIRVLQPKQVRVESSDDHDKTREFVWSRSSHIAHLVSQKLSLATRAMLQPTARSR